MLFQERNEYTVILAVVLQMIGKPSWFHFAGEPHPKHAAFLAVSDAVVHQNETRIVAKPFRNCLVRFTSFLHVAAAATTTTTTTRQTDKLRERFY